jgi:hypothetical protein
MIKREGNIIKVIFGYGTICVGGSLFSVDFTSIKPPQEIGKPIPKDAKVEYGRTVSLNDWDNVYKLLKDLNNIDLTEERTIKYDNIIELVFIKDSYKSLEVVKKHINMYLDSSMLALAC